MVDNMEPLTILFRAVLTRCLCKNISKDSIINQLVNMVKVSLSHWLLNSEIAWSTAPYSPRFSNSFRSPSSSPE